MELSQLLIAKIVAMVVLGLASFAIGLLPIKIAKLMKWNKDPKVGERPILSLLLCFGGGVLLYTALLHLQPEVRVGMTHLEHRGLLPEGIASLHPAELVFCAGFFFVYLVEELVHAVLDRHGHADDSVVLHRTMSLRRCARHPNQSECPDNGTLIPRVSLKKLGDGKSGGSDETNGSTGSYSASTQGLLKTGSSLSTIMILDNSKGNPLDVELRMQKPHQHTLTPSSVAERTVDEEPTSAVAKSVRGLIAVLALSFHAVFEGLAVGLESSVANVWYLFAAIATHKLVIAFCVGFELVTSRTKLRWVILYVATFAAVTPLGVGAGVILSGPDDLTTAVTVVLQGMAAGTLLYVVFFEVLQRERANTQSGIYQLRAIVAGFLVMFALQIASKTEFYSQY